MRWSKRPDMEAVMLECVRGRTRAEAAAEFERRTGEHLEPHNVSAFMQARGLCPRRPDLGRASLPVGTEREGKDGYIKVKVREAASVPGSKDDWEYKQVLVWERAEGRELPDGWVVIFCDHDARNFDPSNLLAVPRSLIGVMNGMGVAWTDREQAEAVMAMAELKVAKLDLLMRTPRRCGVCGREFTPEHRDRPGAQTCPGCRAAGRKAKGRRTYRYKLPVTGCLFCGREFQPVAGRETVCPECRARGLRATSSEGRRLLRERRARDGR